MWKSNIQEELQRRKDRLASNVHNNMVYMGPPTTERRESMNANEFAQTLRGELGELNANSTEANNWNVEAFLRRQQAKRNRRFGVPARRIPPLLPDPPVSALTAFSSATSTASPASLVASPASLVASPASLVASPASLVASVASPAPSRRRKLRKRRTAAAVAAEAAAEAAAAEAAAAEAAAAEAAAAAAAAEAAAAEAAAKPGIAFKYTRRNVKPIRMRAGRRRWSRRH